MLWIKIFKFLSLTMKKLYKIICSSNKTNSLFDASKELEEFLFAGVSFRLKQPSTSFNHWKDHISEMKNYSWDSAEDCVCYIRSHIRWRTVHSIQNWGSFACRLNFWLKQLSTNGWKSHLLEMNKTIYEILLNDPFDSFIFPVTAEDKEV